MPIGPPAPDAMAALADATGGSALLLGWRGDDVEVLDRVDAAGRSLAIPPIDGGTLPAGTEAPLHALLAWLAPDELDRRLRGLSAAPDPVRNRALLALHLVRVRTAGADVVAGGRSGEVTAVAAPVRDACGDVVAALAVLAPTVYLDGLDLRALTADVVRAAALLQLADARAS